MAAGVISEIKVLSRFSIPGGGRTLTGTAVNNKVLVTGQITGAYLSTGGLDLLAEGGPMALGLNTIDFIDFDVVSMAGTESVAAGVLNATYNHNLHTIFVCIDRATKPTDADECIIKFMAIGDDHAANELV